MSGEEKKCRYNNIKLSGNSHKAISFTNPQFRQAVLAGTHPSISLAPDGVLTVEKRARDIYNTRIYYKAAISGVASETKQWTSTNENVQQRHFAGMDERKK